MSEGIKKDILLEDAILGFINSLEGNKQITKTTIKRLGSEAQIFLRYSHFKIKKKSLLLSDTIYPWFVKEYLNKYNHPKTLTNKISFFRFLFSYLISKNYIDNFDVIQAFKERKIVSRETLKIFTNEQLLELIQLSKEGPNAVRTFCLILILATSGSRIDELRHLRLCDIDFENKSLQVNWKGREMRKIRVPYFTIETIREYLKESFQLTGDELKEEKNYRRYLFPSKTEETPISSRIINYIIRDLIEKAQTIPSYYKQGYGARSFRYTFIYQVYQEGMSLDKLSRISGITSYKALKYIHNFELKKLIVE
jgi:site-specific recombinase XerD